MTIVPNKVSKNDFCHNRKMRATNSLCNESVANVTQQNRFHLITFVYFYKKINCIWRLRKGLQLLNAAP